MMSRIFTKKKVKKYWGMLCVGMLLAQGAVGVATVVAETAEDDRTIKQVKEVGSSSQAVETPESESPLDLEEGAEVEQADTNEEGSEVPAEILTDSTETPNPAASVVTDEYELTANDFTINYYELDADGQLKDEAEILKRSNAVAVNVADPTAPATPYIVSGSYSYGSNAATITIGIKEASTPVTVPVRVTRVNSRDAATGFYFRNADFWQQPGSGVYHRDGPVMIEGYDGGLSDITIPETVTDINGEVHTVVAIDDAAMKHVDAPSFNTGSTGCTSELTSVVFPETLVEIGNAAFQIQPLEEIDIPSLVTSIGSYAFQMPYYGDNQWHDRTIRLHPDGPLEIDTDAFAAASANDDTEISIYIAHPENITSQTLGLYMTTESLVFVEDKTAADLIASWGGKQANYYSFIEDVATAGNPNQIEGATDVFIPEGGGGTLSARTGLYYAAGSKDADYTEISQEDIYWRKLDASGQPIENSGGSGHALTFTDFSEEDAGTYQPFLNYHAYNIPDDYDPFSKVRVSLQEPTAEIKVHDSKVTLGESWNPSDNFDSATDSQGNAIDLAEIDVDSEVDMNQTGTYPVTYRYEDSANPNASVAEATAIVTVVDRDLSLVPDTDMPAVDLWSPDTLTPEMPVLSRYSLTAKNVEIHLAEVKNYDVLKLSDAQIVDENHINPDPRVVVLSGAVEEKPGVYEVVLGVDENLRKVAGLKETEELPTKTITVTVLADEESGGNGETQDPKQPNADDGKGNALDDSNSAGSSFDNTKSQENDQLPSTGSEHTLLFSVVGVLLVVAVLIIASVRVLFYFKLFKR